MSANGPERDGPSEAELDELNKLVRAALEADSPSQTQPGPDHDERKGGSFGRFEGLTLVGRGGFGTVHRAYDPKHARYVALKIPSRQNAVDPVMLRRFRVEAEAVAKIDHPGVAPLYEIGEVDGLPYLASAYCEGQNLSQWRKTLAREGRAVAPETAARIALAAARALAAAHEAGVVHRDLKPSNVILQPTPGEGDVRVGADAYRVRVIDFGLAKLFSDGDEQTRTDHHIGTPPYMAPEQFSRRFGTISTRTDVYGLGATLYALLVGRPPFKADEPAELYAQILTEAPPALTVLRPDVPRDLAAICRRCLEKQPRDRYPAMAAVGEDLERFLDGRAVKARWAWLGKWLLGSRRRRTLSAAVVIGAAALGSWFAYKRIDQYRRDRDDAAAHARDLATQKERVEYLSAAQQAFADAEAHNPQGITRFLDRFADNPHRGDVERTLLKGLSDSSTWTVKTDSPEVHSTAVSPDPNNPFVCGGFSDGRVEVRSVKDGAVQKTLRGHRGPVNWLEFLDGGGLLATFGVDGFVRVWETRDWSLQRAFKAHDDWIETAHVSPDGRFLVTCSGDTWMNFWSLPTFEKVDWFKLHKKAVRDAAFSHDCKYLVSCGEDHNIHLWDFVKRSPVNSLPPFLEEPSPDNRWARHVHFLGGGPPYRFAVSFFRGKCAVYGFSPGERPHLEWSRDLGVVRSFVPPGATMLYFTRRDGALARADLSAPDAEVEVLGHGHQDKGFALSGDPARGLFATGDRQGLFRLWDSRRDSLGWTHQGFAGAAGFVGVDHVAVESYGRGSELMLFRGSDGSLVETLRAPSLPDGSNPALPYRALRFPDEVWRAWRTGWEVISLKSGKPVPTERPIPFARPELGDGSLPWVRDEKRQCVSIFTQDMSREVARLPATLTDLQAAYVSPDGRFVACEYPGAIRLFEMKPPHKEIKLEDADRLGRKSDPAFSAGGDFLAVGFADGSAIVWSSATGLLHARVVGRRDALRGAFATDDGKRVLAVDRRGRLYLWDAASCALLGSVPLASNVDDVRAELALDGRRLLVDFNREGEQDDSSVRVIKLRE